MVYAKNFYAFRNIAQDDASCANDGTVSNAQPVSDARVHAHKYPGSYLGPSCDDRSWGNVGEVSHG